jgi:hypothetical protein
MRPRTEIVGQSGNVPMPGPVASGPEWYPNFVEHWLFWLAFGLGMLALIFVGAAIRRRLGRHLNTSSHQPVDVIADVLDVQPQKLEREKARPGTGASR